MKDHGKENDCRRTAILPDESDTDCRISETQPFYAQAQAGKPVADTAPGPRGGQEGKPPPARFKSG